MALLDTPQPMYGGMTSPYLIQNTYTRPYTYRDYSSDTIARFNFHQRLQVSPEYCRSVKEEFTAAFKPYSPGQENLPFNGSANKVVLGFVLCSFFFISNNQIFIQKMVTLFYF